MQLILFVGGVNEMDRRNLMRSLLLWDLCMFDHGIVSIVTPMVTHFLCSLYGGKSALDRAKTEEMKNLLREHAGKAASVRPKSL